MTGVPQNTLGILAEIQANITANGVMGITPQVLSQMLQDIAVSYENNADNFSNTTAINAVSEYGCDNTGGSNTSIALQAAITIAIASGRPLFIPAGTYDCGNASLNVTGQLDVYGAGRTQTTILRSSTNGLAPLFNISGSNVRLRDMSLSFTGPITTVQFFEAAAIAGPGVINIKYQNLEVKGAFYVGLTFYSVANGWMDKCYVHGGIHNRLLYAYGTCSNILVSECIMDGNNNQTFYGLDCNPADLGIMSRITVVNSICQNALAHGFSVADSVYTAALIGCHAYGVVAGAGFLVDFANGNSPTRVSLIGCSSIFNQLGVEFFNTLFGSIVGCRINNNTSGGILVADSKNCTISGNEIDGNVGFGIEDSASVALVSSGNIYMGNTSISNTTYGIETTATSDRIIVYGNTAYLNGVANVLLNATNPVTASNITA